MFCSNCGKQVPADTKFCPFCGAKLQVTSTASTSAAPTATNWQRRLTIWYHGLKYPWLAWVVLVVLIVGIGGGVYHHQGLKAQAARYNSWYVVSKAGLAGRPTSDGVTRLVFRQNGRVALNADDDADSLPNAVGMRVKDFGNWQGDHNQLTLHLSENGSSLKMTFTKRSKFSKVINGTKYQGYLVQANLVSQGDNEHANVYLLHR